MTRLGKIVDAHLSQTFSYSFEGNFDSEQLRLLETKCRAIDNVSTCKVKYKLESGKGEIIVRVMSIKEKKDSNESFSPIDMKRELLDFGATPLEFIKLID